MRAGTASFHLPADLEAAASAELDAWRAGDKVRRLWARDATLWTGTDEASWLGWLGVARDQLARVDALRELAAEVRAAGFTHALVLGMGGSSLCPEVLKMTFDRIAGYPELFVLDSTDPGQIRAIERKIDVASTLFIVSSKSGSTLEPNIFMRYFFDRAKQLVGADRAGSRFITITDPGSRMQEAATADGFRRILFGVPSIGGRYSALSDFGMAPAAIMGLDAARFLGHADAMAGRCGASVPAAENPGALLGILLGVLARHGRDKVTLIASPGIADLGAWLEQLLAESTGKRGKGLIPVDREAAGALPAESPLRVGDPACAAAVKALLRTVTPGDYVAFLAYVPMNETHEVLLQAARLAVRDTLRVATCVGFGPRYLHSTGQAYKGGPNSGVFIQIICDDPDDLAVPGRRYSFGVVKAAQALGDFRVLQERGRRALRVHLGSDVKAGLALLGRALEA